MKKLILSAFALFMWMAGCETGIPKNTDVTCAGAHNEGSPAYCNGYVAYSGPMFITTARAYNLTVELGNISRSTMVIGEGVVDNPVPSDFYGYAEFIIIDGGCNGASSWDLMPKQAVSVGPNTSKDVVGVGGQCGDMPLGPHTATATVWLSDGITQVGQATIHFNLVN